MVTSAASFPDSFQELVRACSSFYKSNLEKISTEHVRHTRSKLSGFARVFHEQCGTLTPSVKEGLEDLKGGRCIVLMTAHQPNFFPYSGVFRKATLCFLLSERLEESLGVPVVNFFGIADQDFTDDLWVRSFQLPAVQRSEGIMSVDVKLPEKLMLYKVAKPSEDLVKGWKIQIENWIHETANSVGRLLRTMGLENPSTTDLVSKLRENFESFWSIVVECYEASTNYSDFNAFLLSKIINKVWGYNTVFARFSECQQIFLDDFRYLLSRFDAYSNLLSEARALPYEDDKSGGASDLEPQLVPFWYHCDCGGKVRLFMEKEKQALIGRGTCVKCGQSYSLSLGSKISPAVSNIDSRISARAISMNLVFFRGLMPSCYVGGIAGIRYLTEAQHVAEGLEIPFPPVVVWRPCDKYLGIGQVEALLEMKRICSKLGARDFVDARDLLKSRMQEIHAVLYSYESEKKRLEGELEMNPSDTNMRERVKQMSIKRSREEKASGLSVIARELEILQNALRVLNLIPSVVDYAVNLGLGHTSSQWLNHLDKVGSLIIDVKMDSIVSQMVTPDFIQSVAPS